MGRAENSGQKSEIGGQKSEVEWNEIPLLFSGNGGQIPQSNVIE